MFQMIPSVIGPLLAAAAVVVASEQSTSTQSPLPASCYTVLTLDDAATHARTSTKKAAFFREAAAAGIDTSRIQVMKSLRDRNGPSAGVWRAHVTAWQDAIARGCKSLVVMEDDVFFDESTTTAGFAAAEAVLSSGQHFDVLLLGHYPNVAQEYDAAALADVRDDHALDCVMQLKSGWSATHAYLISESAMQRWGQIEWRTNAVHFGHLDLAIADPEGPFGPAQVLSVFPPFAFQRYHRSDNPWTGGAKVGSAVPGWQSKTQALWSNPLLVNQHLMERSPVLASVRDRCIPYQTRIALEYIGLRATKRSLFDEESTRQLWQSYSQTDAPTQPSKTEEVEDEDGSC